MHAEPKKSFLLRIDPKLWTELERWAADDLRSVNAQLEFLLRDAVKKRRGDKSLSPEGSPPGGNAAGAAPSEDLPA